MSFDSAAAHEHPESGLFVEVALPVPMKSTFTYRIKNEREVSPGVRLIVPFGKQKLTGYCVAVHEELDPELGLEESKVREVTDVVDDVSLLTPEILELTRWAADYYSVSWGEMLKSSLPAGINSLIQTVYRVSPSLNRLEEEITLNQTLNLIKNFGIQNEKELVKTLGKSKAKRELSNLLRAGAIERAHEILAGNVGVIERKWVRLTDGTAEPDNASQSKVVTFLKTRPDGVAVAELKEETGVSDSPLKTLEKRGIVEIYQREVKRDPLKNIDIPEYQEFELTEDQKRAKSKVVAALRSNEYKAFLIHGVTGSGKTEVYIRAIQETLSLGKSALMLVPEISLTPVFSKQLRSVFGKDVAILHSSLSAGERFDEWRRIYGNEAKVVIGTRSAVFAPISNLGLIVVDEEHDTSYRQHEMPFYSGRDIAVVRAMRAKATIVLGSATPAIESYQNALDEKYELIEMPNRVSDRALPKASLVDMREALEADAPTGKILSPELRAAIEETYERGEQSMILLNRRGFSQFVLCRKCGETIQCKNCDITLTFHHSDQRLTCHYCSFSIKAPSECPQCDSPHLFFLGEGTEQLEGLLKDEFEDIRISRVDRDSVRRKGEMESILTRFANHEIDMLVGTQMIAKGHDFPNVTLVGVVSVDGGLGMPDFRSAERTFQLLTQTAGRAGRGEKPGRVLIQTYRPNHYVLKLALEQNYKDFFEREIGFREKFIFPPYVSMVQLLFKHSKYKTAYENAAKMKEALDASVDKKNTIVLGPAPAPLIRIRNQYRIQVFLKSKNRKKMHEAIKIAEATAANSGFKSNLMTIEIDPVSLL